MGVGNKLPRDIAQFVCRTRPFVDTILLSSTEMRVHRSRPCRWITTIDKAPVNEFPLVKFSSLANHRWTMERSLVRPTNYNELGPFGGIRESIASECRELVRICHSILNRYFNRYIPSVVPTM